VLNVWKAAVLIPLPPVGSELPLVFAAEFGPPWLNQGAFVEELLEIDEAEVPLEADDAVVVDDI
jgi:hypothetical protein